MDWLEVTLLAVSIVFILIGSSNIDVAFNRYYLAYITGNKEIVKITDIDIFGNESTIDKVYLIGHLQLFIAMLINLFILALIAKNKFVKNKVKL